MPKTCEEYGVCRSCGRKIYLIDGTWFHGRICAVQAKKHVTQYVSRDRFEHQAAPRAKKGK